MNTVDIESKLGSAPDAKSRQARLLSELARTFAERGAEAVTNDLVGRIDRLQADFDAQLRQLNTQT